MSPHAPLLTCLLSTLAPDLVAVPQVEVQRVLGSMGTTLELRVSGPTRATALEASEAAVRALEASERRLSTWIADSELAALNAQPGGRALSLSPTLARELEAARLLWRETDGAFDPTVGPLTRAWGLRAGGRVPSRGELADALEAVGMEHLALDGQCATRLRPTLVLDEGGFGKGAGLDAALEALRTAGALRATLDLGGQLALLDDRPDAAPFEHALAHPRRRDIPIARLRLESGSLATSGNSERGLTVDGVRRGHLLDPRTGEPVDDFGSVTVWTSAALRADALSTALFVMGPERALAWAEKRPGVEVLVAIVGAKPAGLQLRATSGWRGRVETTLEGLEVQFTRSATPPTRHP